MEKAPDDYLASFARLADYADYPVLNVSSPNTQICGRLQDGAKLRGLLSAIATSNRRRATDEGKDRVPLLLKIVPDLTCPQIDALRTAAAPGRIR